MPNVGTLSVEMALSQAKFTADIGKAAAEAEKAAKRIEHTIEQNNEKFKEWGKTLLAAGGITLGLEGILHVIESVAEKTIEGQRSFAALNATLQATQNAAGLTSSRLEALNTEIQSKSVFDDDGIRQAEAALLRFRTIQRGVFEDAIRLVPDVATALGTDLPAAAQAVGRALTDPEAGMKALRAAGIFLSESQKDLARSFIESGDKASAQKVIIDELAKSVGGLAEGDTKGLYGATKRLTRAQDELKKALGNKLADDTSIKLATTAYEALAHAIEHSTGSLAGFFTKLTTGGGGAIEIADRIFGAVSGRARDNNGTLVTGKIRVGASEEEKAKSLADQKERDDAAYKHRKLLLQRQAASISGYQQDQINEQKSALDIEQTQLTFAYGHQSETISSFFDRSRDLIQRNAEVATRELELLKQRQVAILNAPAQDGKGHAFSDDERLAAASKVEQITTQQNKIKLDARKAELILQNQQTDAERAFADQIRESGIRLLELNNEKERAAEARFNLDNRPKFDSIKSRRESGTDAEKRTADALSINLTTELQILKARARFNQEAEEGAQILGAVANEQSRIDLAVKSGRINEIEGLRQSSALNQALLAPLQARIDSLQRIADVSHDPQMLADIDALKLKMEGLAAATDQFGDRVQKIFHDSFSDGIAALVDGTKSARDVIKDIEKSIASSLTRIASNDIADTIFGKSGALGSIGSFFSDAFGGKPRGGEVRAGSLLSSLLGDGSSGAALATPALTALAAAAQTASAALLSIGGSSAASSLLSPGFGAYGGLDFGGFFAGGGSPPLGRVSLVGERGPELFVPKQAGTIIPNAALGGRRASVQSSIHITVNVPASTSSSSAQQIARRTGIEVQRAMARS